MTRAATGKAAGGLIVVESPAKARTLQSYLGKDYRVLACNGHVRDLKSGGLSIDTKKGFAMEFEPVESSKAAVARIRSALAKMPALYLATDPDREGEAIAWHLLELLSDAGALEDKQVHRVAFNQITRSAVNNAVDDPRDVSMPLVEAQKARRCMDRLLGFTLSPLLSRILTRGLSAGRVQSPALKLIVEREKEIEAFRPREYWSVTAHLGKDGQDFEAALVELNGEKLKKFSLSDAAATEQARDALLAAMKEGAPGGGPGVLTVANVKPTRAKRGPPPPFTTSTMQQAASRQLGMQAQRTMRVAQSLYEGVDTGGGAVGLITYMRTDSVQMAREAVQEIREYVVGKLGAGFVPKAPRRYRTKTRNAQEAHEAIRPTSIARAPETLKSHLDSDQYRLYDIIWRRAVASQMSDALYDRVSAEFTPGTPSARVAETTPAGRFRATGNTLAHPGFLKVLARAADSRDKALPPLATGETLDVRELATEQHFTEPPPRYTEASLVKALEDHGIGRPSTYAETLRKIRDREYAVMEKRNFAPTQKGRMVADFLTRHFNDYVDYDFTAGMEESLDAVANGEKHWVPVMDEFWSHYSERLAEKKRTLKGIEERPRRLLGEHPESGESVYARLGPYGYFVQVGERTEDHRPPAAPLREGFNYEDITLEQALELLRGPRQLGTDPATGQPVYAGSGRSGPYVQLGERGGGEKPKYASLTDGLSEESVTLEDALKLLSLPRELGPHTESGDTVYAGRGRFGPYVQLGERGKEKPKYASLPPDISPYTVTLDEAVALLRLPRELGKHPDNGRPVFVGCGVKGPYVQIGERGGKTRPRYIRLPKPHSVFTLTLEEALKVQPARRARRPAIREFEDGGIRILDGRYGPYVTDGSRNASVPRGQDPAALSLEQCRELLKNAPKKGSRRRSARR
ncbi:MAG: type I DNA topoisomerase [Gammaproteobacteria bacterium]|nr:type I DNA topoisomerase [Gammaproteobacteria bacterium]MYD01479.1 type I DNA topoisomerase [Gammaproteobacteria bacterium]MYI26153.1 type I DNA topoisomerase [Gammaproteobacteria bacterium]